MITANTNETKRRTCKENQDRLQKAMKKNREGYVNLSNKKCPANLEFRKTKALSNLQKSYEIMADLFVRSKQDALEQYCKKLKNQTLHENEVAPKAIWLQHLHKELNSH